MDGEFSRPQKGMHCVQSQKNTVFAEADML
jgi:hypothetical protein